MLTNNEMSPIDEEIDETQPLLDVQITNDSRMVTICDVFGSITTFMAMVPQGILGALLTDKILLQLNKDFNSNNVPLLIVRIGIDGLMFITAEEGKRRLVRFFNTETFKNFGRLQWWKNNFFTHWSILDVCIFLLNAGFTIVASGVFSGLTVISFDGIAELFNNYQSNATDEIAKWMKSYYIKIPFMLATFISNLPFFPSVHKNMYKLLSNGWYYLIENPALRHFKQIIITDIQSAQFLWKQINENHEETAKQEFLIQYNAANKDSLAKRLVSIGQISGKKIKLEYWLEFLIKHGVAISLTGISIAGLYNFLDMTDKTAALFHIEKAAPVLRWMDYISMSSVAFSSVYNVALTLISSVCFGRRYNVNLISNFSYFWILFTTFMVCTLGGAPNAYQSVIAQEDLTMIIIAAIDSLLMEAYGYYQLTKSNKIIALSENDEAITEAYKIDTEIENTLTYIESTASTEEISRISESIPIIPEHRSSYNSIKHVIGYCLFGDPEKVNSDNLDFEDFDSALILKRN